MKTKDRETAENMELADVLDACGTCERAFFFIWTLLKVFHTLMSLEKVS